MPIARYQQKPPVVDALMYNGSNHDEITAWCPEATYKDGLLFLYNNIKVSPNEWIVTGVCGNWSRYTECFPQCYDPVSKDTELA